MDRSGALIDRLVAWSPVLLLGGLAALTYWLDAQVQAARRAPRRHRAPRSRHLHRELPRRRASTPTARCGSRSPRGAPSIIRTTTASTSRRRRSRSPIRASRGSRSPPTRERCPATARPSRSAATCARRATRVPDGAPASNDRRGPDHVHHRDAARRPEEGAGRDRRPGDDRGAAWNNPGRRHGARQQGAHDQAQVRRRAARCSPRSHPK